MDVVAVLLIGSPRRLWLCGGALLFAENQGRQPADPWNKQRRGDPLPVALQKI
jgi:hypothetical protein